jgi:hypothetical protein
LFDKNEVIFNYSSNKLNVSKELLTDNSYKILKDIVKIIEDKFEDTFGLYSARKGFKIFKSKNFDNIFTSEYIDYLSRYSNNIIGFSAPRSINLEVNADVFDNLFCKFVDVTQAEKVDKTRIKPIEFIKEKHREIVRYYNVGNEVSHNYIPNLITPVKIDFSGQNDIDVYAQTLDMETPYNHISSHVNAFGQLKTAYADIGKPMQDFILCQEPPKHLKKQHDIWAQLRSTSKFNVVDISESQRIIDYAIEHGVRPLIANYPNIITN